MINKNGKRNKLIVYLCVCVCIFSGLVYYLSTCKMAASLPSYSLQIPPLLSIENNSLFIQKDLTQSDHLRIESH